MMRSSLSGKMKQRNTCTHSSALDLMMLEGEDDDNVACESNSEGPSSHWQVVDYYDSAVNDN